MLHSSLAWLGDKRKSRVTMEMKWILKLLLEAWNPTESPVNAQWVCWRKTQWHLHSFDNKSRNEPLVGLGGNSLIGREWSRDQNAGLWLAAPSWPRPLTICLVNHPRMHWADDFWHSLMAQFWRQCCMRATSSLVLDQIQRPCRCWFLSSFIFPPLFSFKPRVRACIIMSGGSSDWRNPSHKTN